MDQTGPEKTGGQWWEGKASETPPAITEAPQEGGRTTRVFTTKKHLRICANPEHNWVKEAMEYLDKKNAPPNVSEVSTIFYKHVTLSTQTGGPPHPAGTFTTPSFGSTTLSVVNVVTAGPEMEKSSTEATPKSKVVVTGMTLPSETLGNGSTVANTTSEPKTFGERLMPVSQGPGNVTESMNDLVASSTTPGPPATSRLDSGKPMGSTQSTSHLSSTSFTGSTADSTVNGMKSTTSSDRLLNSVDLQGSVLRSSAAETRPTVSLTTVTPGLNVTGQSSTPSSSEESKTNSPINVTDRWGVVNDSTAALGNASESPVFTEANRVTFPKISGTLPTSGHHQAEKNKAEAPSHAPISLERYRTHFISLAVLGSALCIVFAAMWAYSKYCIYDRASSPEMIQGLLFSPLNSKTTAFAMDIL
ncbi:fractalkine isoform X2 [Hemicordylus capensis]|uniref:fractalkine isoform X2 n=1 Tax=Hemicordylus capensis TaxID=884348 RepID=UPI00230444FE|nr:fractalkine isoform X2 [Hemicordylus capensis]